VAKRFIIDGQLLQTNAWYRGMGKYTMQVMQELSRKAPTDIELSVIFNRNLNSDQIRFETVKFLCPRIQQKHYKLPIPNGKKVTAETYTRALSNKLTEDFDGDDKYYFLTSLFQFDFFAEYPSDVHKLLLLYDLIPLLFWQDLGGYFPPELYMQRFQRLIETEHIFSISETTRQDLLKTLGLPPGKVTNINGGLTKIADSNKKPINFKVPDKFILFPTGDLPHKNNEITIKGYEEYRTKSENALPLLITSQFHSKSKKRLSTSKGVIFTGNVLDEELEWLYENAQAVLFTSKYEGLGMPVLDAVASQKPVIASQISVFEEMSKSAFYYFEPADYKALAIAISNAVKHEAFSEKLKQYPGILEKYTWSNTCKIIVDYIKSVSSSNLPRPPKDPRGMRKPAVAVVCLHPGINGQIGRAAESMHASLIEEFEVDYYFDANGYHYREMERPTILDFLDCKAFDICKLTLRTYKKYDRIVYLIDSLAFPSRVAQRACVLPGVALFDFAAAKLDKQQKMLKELILDNQYSVYPLNKHSYSAYQELGRVLHKEIANTLKNPNRAESIIRKGGSNSGIIYKLAAIDGRNDK
jgi:glycosyltransferase involved in cell wall biosynthesis